MAEITPQDLLPLLSTPDAPRLVDVCTPEDHALDPRILPGAQRAAHKDRHDPGPMTVFICQKGLKLSQGAAALHIASGGRAVFLQGGMVTWAQRGLPLITGAPARRWVVAEGPEAALTDWIAARLLPSGSEMLVTHANARDAVAEKFDACAVEGAADMLDKISVEWQRAHQMVDQADRLRDLLSVASRRDGRRLLDLAFAALSQEAV